VIRVDPASFIPIYEQVKQEILRLVATGRLKVHDPLPSIRDLAAEIIINPNTVARAYRELEQTGLISTQKGRGSFIAPRAGLDAANDRKTRLARVMDGAIAEARKFALADDDILKIFEERLSKNANKTRGGRHE